MDRCISDQCPALALLRGAANLVRYQPSGYDVRGDRAFCGRVDIQSDNSFYVGITMKMLMQRTVPLFLFSFLSVWATTALSQFWKLDCEISSYGPHYSTGKALEVAKSWVPETSTHIIRTPESYHVEHRGLGSAETPPNRIVMKYAQYGESGVKSNLIYIYLIKNDIVTVNVVFGGDYYNIHARGRCRSSEISDVEARKLLP